MSYIHVIVSRISCRRGLRTNVFKKVVASQPLVLVPLFITGRLYCCTNRIKIRPCEPGNNEILEARSLDFKINRSTNLFLTDNINFNHKPNLIQEDKN